MRFTFERAIEEFLSTFKEWHYFIVGIAIGFLIGIDYYREHIDRDEP